MPDESTVFGLPRGSVVWYHDLEDHYEAQRARKLVRAVPPGQGEAPPMTFMLAKGGGYGSITEGGLRDYRGLVLQADGAGGFDSRPHLPRGVSSQTLGMLFNQHPARR